MKRRFDISSPLNGRSTPPDRHHYSLRRPALNVQPTPRQAPLSSSQSADELFVSGVELHLQDEVSAQELEKFTISLLGFLSSNEKQRDDQELMQIVTDHLPSFVQLKIEHRGALGEKKDHHQFTKKLVKASEPLLNHQSIPESEKSGLLDVSVLAVEKMMQLKMRESHLRQRIEFLELEIPRHLREHAEEFGYTDRLGREIAQLTQVVLSDY